MIFPYFSQKIGVWHFEISKPIFLEKIFENVSAEMFSKQAKH